MHHPQRLTYLFERYLSGDCSPHEMEEFVALLHEEGAEKDLDGSLKALWDQSGADTASVDWESMFREITMTRAGTTSIRRRWGLWLAAASVALMLGAAGWWVTRRTPSILANVQTPAKTIAAAPGRKTHTVHLPDGSTVTLNVSSRLDYPTAFTGKNREVYLSGEGFFDIKPSPGHPFLVHTGKILTRVLGTRFNIRAYPSDKAIDITVDKGKVQVLDEEKSLGTLVDHQQIHFVRTTAAFEKQTVDVQAIIAWKPLEIFYDNVRMEEVAKALEQRFSVKVTFANSAIKDCRVTATFSPEDGLEEILTVLCAVNQSLYTIKGSSVVLTGQGCS